MLLYVYNHVSFYKKLCMHTHNKTKIHSNIVLNASDWLHEHGFIGHYSSFLLDFMGDAINVFLKILFLCLIILWILLCLSHCFGVKLCTLLSTLVFLTKFQIGNLKCNHLQVFWGSPIFHLFNQMFLKNKKIKKNLSQNQQL